MHGDRATIRDFQNVVWGYYHTHRRDMPWRKDHSFYAVLVSEMMLQQTQVNRVKEKFRVFMEAFPTIEQLATAPLSDVLSVWQGLGYNRRAKYLWLAAQYVEQNGQPRTLDDLQHLPGVGRNTAGAMMAYVYNEPSVFVETNIRTVYIHHFFHDDSHIDDNQILAVLAQTLDTKRPREWYWALMDYGSFLKQQITNIAQSKHYKKQSPLAGSLREMRGKIIKSLVGRSWDRDELFVLFDNDDRFGRACDGLIADGLIEQSGATLRLTGKNQSA